MNNNTQADTLFQMGRISRKLFSARPRGEHGPVGRGPMGNSQMGHHPLGNGQIKQRPLGNDQMEQRPLGRTQGMILDTIISNPDISQDELASKLKLDKTTIAKVVKKLEINGIITRVKSTVDARKYQLKATEKAEKIRDHITAMREERSKLAFEGIAADEIEAFKKTLDKIEENIERNRMKLRNKPFEHIGSVIDILIKEDGITEEQLFEKLGMDPELFEQVLSGLKKRGLAEEKDGMLYATDKAKDIKQNGRGKMIKHHRRGHGRKMHRPHE